MQLYPPDNLICPLDGEPLRHEQGCLLCARGHSFDIARQGYVHLLPVQHKRSRDPGDSKEMIAARTRFLETGVYSGLSDALNQLCEGLLAGREDACVLDAGCGEGYYLHALARHLLACESTTRLRMIGMDISKWAVIAAARRNRGLNWLVASNRQPPLAPGSVDVILCLFGFPVYPAFARLLRPGGALVLVDPGPDHLLELRSVVYPHVRQSPPPGLEAAFAEGFVLHMEETLRFQTPPLVAEQIADLLIMTPHLYRAPATGKAAAQALKELVCTVDVRVRLLTRSAA